MNAQDARVLFAYDAWANRRLLAAAARLSPTDFVRDLGASFGSVRGTLLHIMWGEKRHFEYWRTGTRIDDPRIEDFPDAASLEAMWLQVDSARQAFAAELSDENLDRVVIIRGSHFALRELVQHVGNHSTYHREHELT